MNIYEKNRALNIKMKLKTFFKQCINKTDVKPENIYCEGAIYCLNNDQSLVNEWILNNKSNDFGIFVQTEEGEIKDFIRVNITSESNMIGYLVKEVQEKDENDELITITKFDYLYSEKVHEYDVRMFLNAIYINGELKKNFNFNIDFFDFTLKQEEYIDYIASWTGSQNPPAELLNEFGELVNEFGQKIDEFGNLIG